MELIHRKQDTLHYTETRDKGGAFADFTEEATFIV